MNIVIDKEINFFISVLIWLTYKYFFIFQNYFMLTSSMDKTVRLWHISRKECLCIFQHMDFVTAIAFHPKVNSSYFLIYFSFFWSKILFIKWIYTLISLNEIIKMLKIILLNCVLNKCMFLNLINFIISL